MTLTIDLQPEIESSLIGQAKARGVSLSDHAREILARASVVTIPASSKAPEAKNLYEHFAPVRGMLTDQEIDLYFSRTPSASRPVDFE